VHDELIVECPEAIAPQVAELVSSQMQTVAQLAVPLQAEAKIGKSWYDAK
jgi:DNA polymerase-1